MPITDRQLIFQNGIDVKLDYIQRDVNSIKSDVNDIKKDFVTRREFTDGLKSVRDDIPDESDHEARIRSLETRVWKFIGALIVCQVIILPVILFIFYKQL